MKKIKNLANLALLALLPLAVASAPALALDNVHADNPESPAKSLRERYTKYEYLIPMRDGVKLMTVVYVPKDTAKSYPFLINRTPYSAGVYDQGELHYGEDFFPNSIGPSPEFESSGYIFVKQDVRGRYMSEGKWQEMTPHLNAHRAAGEGNESEDMHDTVDWLLKHVANNNGKVGIYGISYPGFYTSASIINSHPAIKAASPQAPVTDLFMNDDSYHGGAFMLSANFDFYSSFTTQKNPTAEPKRWSKFDYGTSDSYDFFLAHKTYADLMGTLTENQRDLLQPTIEHSTYDDFWQSRNIAPHLKNIKAAVLTVGGWFDAEDLHGPLATYQAVKQNNPGTYGALVMGPWSHGGWARFDGAALGNVQFDAKTGDYFRKNILLPFFELNLKGAGSKPSNEAIVFETGSNVWRNYSTWPPQPAQQRTLYLAAHGKLDWHAPSASDAGYDEYISDPNKPVPYVGYPTVGVPQEYMTSDQRFAAKRNDVLVYSSEPLDQDLTVVGSVTPKLFVSTSGTDSDWVVKLIDVYPMEYQEHTETGARANDVVVPHSSMAGYEQLVRGDPLRGKFRHSFEHPEPFVPGKVELISYGLQDINHTFRRGHRIMVQIQSSWFPLVDLNPQTFVDIPKAKAEDFQKATQRVYHSPDMASGLQLLTLPQH